MEDLELWKKAGNIAAKARDFGLTLIKKDTSLLEATEKVEEFILKNKGGLAFPPQYSLNSIAAHYCASYNDLTIFKENDLVKLDVGVEVNGCIGDTAASLYLGKDPEMKRLVDASRIAVEEALNMIKVGVRLMDIGDVIQKVINKQGFNPILNLSGHGLDKFKIHTEPTIPNFNNKNDEKINKNKAFAIEPFATNGYGMVVESGVPEVFMLVQKKPVRSAYAREILKDLDKYNGFPFAKRWLCKKYGLGKTQLALKELEASGSIVSFAPLADKAKGMVSQHEHSVVIDEDKVIVTTKE